MICEVGLKINNARSIHISNDTNVVTGACGQDFSYNPPPSFFSCVPMIIYFVYQTSKCSYFNISNKSRGLIFCRPKKVIIGTQENNEGGTKVLPTSTCNCGIL